MDGGGMLRTCTFSIRDADGERLDGKELTLGLYCSSYVEGFLDGIALTAETTRATKNVCLPSSGITSEQAIRIFVKYLRSNPEVLHESGRSSLYIALAKAFPCR